LILCRPRLFNIKGDFLLVIREPLRRMRQEGIFEGEAG
jgi:hypothetical protein